MLKSFLFDWADKSIEKLWKSFMLTLSHMENQTSETEVNIVNLHFILYVPKSKASVNKIVLKVNIAEKINI